MSDDALIAAVIAGLQPLFLNPAHSIGHAMELRPLLTATESRAVGCWRHEHGALELSGFLAVDDMSADVQCEFVEATRHVPLTATQFGIVQAVVAAGPAINHRAEHPAAVSDGSIGWLGRFAAASSLAIPVYRETALLGALAVATSERIEPQDSVWQFVTEVVRRLTVEAGD